MGIFVNISDFDSGRYKINLSPSDENDLNEMINNNEKSYIFDLFGVTLGNEIFTNPTTARLELTSPFIEKIEDKKVESKGLKEILKGLIYFEYVRYAYTKQTPSGIGQPLTEGMSQENYMRHDLTTRYNSAVDSWLAIQWKCKNQNYPTYDGEELEFIIPI